MAGDLPPSPGADELLIRDALLRAARREAPTKIDLLLVRDHAAKVLRRAALLDMPLDVAIASAMFAAAGIVGSVR